jgi:hypothetical protein
VSEAIARAQLAPMSRAMRAHGITTRARARAFVATVLHESRGLRAMNEIGGGHKYEGRAAGLGNTHAARTHPQHVAPSAILPRQHHDLVADANAVEGLEHGGLEDEPSVWRVRT